MLIKSVATRPNREAIGLWERESELWSVEWTENTLDIQGGEYNGPLNSVGVRDSNPCAVENSHMVFNSPKTGRIGSRTNCGYQYLQML